MKGVFRVLGDIKSIKKGYLDKFLLLNSKLYLFEFQIFLDYWARFRKKIVRKSISRLFCKEKTVSSHWKIKMHLNDNITHVTNHFYDKWADKFNLSAFFCKKNLNYYQ